MGRLVNSMPGTFYTFEPLLDVVEEGYSRVLSAILQVIVRKRTKTRCSMSF